jgi:hypothetical protein
MAPKSIIIFSVLLAVLGVTGIAAHIGIFRTSKIEATTESGSIPHFVDTMMARERISIEKIAKDSGIQSRLTKLGFTAISGRTIDYVTATAIAQLYEAYDSLYPTHMFISFKGVYELMKRYDLKFGTTQTYIGNIPEDRIDSMDKFKSLTLLNRATWYPLHDATTDMKDLANEHNGYGNIRPYVQDTYGLIKNKWNETIPQFAMENARCKEHSHWAATPYYILAPASKFEGEANEQGNYGNDSADPIVLAPVEGGYIIVTAW